MLQCACELQTLIEAAIAAQDDTLDPAVAAKAFDIADMAAAWPVKPETEAAEPLFYEIADENEEETPQEETEEETAPEAVAPQQPVETEPEVQPTDGQETQPADEPATTTATAARTAVGKPVFSVNDRFRFIRTLFDGSADAFNDALTAVAGMDSYEEAEDYFFGEKEWNPEDPETEEFTGILRKYFNQ